MRTTENPIPSHTDVVLIGAGIMSATLGIFLKLLEPELSILIVERLDKPGAESSDALNNAGTGHSAFCELNYTPEREDGSIDITKALKIAESFEVSKEFWAFLVSNKIIPSADFIHRIPHMTFVRGEKDIDYLKKRFEALQSHPLFCNMKYYEGQEELKKFIPLMMEGRNPVEKVAATMVDIGTDVNFGALTNDLINSLKKMPSVQVLYNCEVKNFDKDETNCWEIKIKDINTGHKFLVKTNFVFIGAGGKSITLLEKSGIPEGKGFGGFPVSGQWLICQNEEIINRHSTKVYGKAAIGAPPMSVPHLDTRLINGKKALLFGPYAGFSTKFLKKGSYMDLLLSLQTDNIIPMVAAGLHNIPLTKYLIDQVTQSMEERLETLKEFLPDARLEDWKLEDAGMRVQVIKKDEKEKGVLEFGTEVVCAADGSIAALLGASPGASTSVVIMLDVLKKCFHEKMNSVAWKNKLKEMIPTIETNLDTHPELCSKIRKQTSEVLNLL